MTDVEASGDAPTGGCSASRSDPSELVQEVMATETRSNAMNGERVMVWVGRRFVSSVLRVGSVV